MKLQIPILLLVFYLSSLGAAVEKGSEELDGPNNHKLVQAEKGKLDKDGNHVHKDKDGRIGDPSPRYPNSICSSCLLFNLTSDPTETNNLLFTDDTIYDSTVEFFEARVDYWTQFFQTPEVTEAVDTYWHLYGCGPWTSSDYEIPVIEQKFSYSEAPNIIYVLIDDWGWNDLGSRSTFLNWTTPHIDSLYLNDAISLTNYYSNELCAPSRGSLLTGRYAFRIGFQNGTNENLLYSELDVSEYTIAQEMKSAGYRTYSVGKWDVGFSTTQSLPNARGFDYFYGYYNGFVDYWTKSYGSFADLHENAELVTNEQELDSSYHAGFLYEAKVEELLRNHSVNYPTTPLFLYYAMQLIHTPYEAPQRFMDRCEDMITNVDDADDDTLANYKTYCAMNVMLDEVIANLTCTLNDLGLSKNTILVLASDNGGDKEIAGNTYPFVGQKGSYFRGGVSATAMIISDLIPEERRGTSYAGTMHITDWLPTLMNPATNGEWEGGYSNQTLDGVDMWEAILTDSPSPRVETVHVIGDEVGTYAAILYGDMKFMKTFNYLSVVSPQVTFVADSAPENSVVQCQADSFGSSSFTYFTSSKLTDESIDELKSATSGMMRDVAESVTVAYDGVSSTLVLGFILLVFTMIGVKSVYDCSRMENNVSELSKDAPFQQYNPTEEALSLFEDDTRTYGSMKDLCNGP